MSGLVEPPQIIDTPGFDERHASRERPPERRAGRHHSITSGRGRNAISLKPPMPVTATRYF